MERKLLFYTVLLSIRIEKSHLLNHGRDAELGEFPFVVRIVIAEEAVHEEDDDMELTELSSNIKYNSVRKRNATMYNSSVLAREVKKPKIDDGILHKLNIAYRHNTNMSSLNEKAADNRGHLKEVHKCDLGRIAAGVLINEARILTTCDSVGFFTGQKVNLHDVSRVSIMGGSVNKTGYGGQFRRPSNSSVHPYCYSLISGIVLFNYGIYQLKTPFIVNWALKPAEMLFQNAYQMGRALRRMYMGLSESHCASAGWGYPRKEFEGKGMPDHFIAASPILQTTNMTMVRYKRCYNQTCVKLGECLLAIWEYGFVCAEAEAGGPCMNDKGAPIVCDNQVFGLHTNQYRCEDEGIPRHFLRIDLAIDYIYGMSGDSVRWRFSLLVLTVSALPVACTLLKNAF